MMNGLNYGVHQGEISESPLMNCVVVVRVLAYGCSAKAIGNYACVMEDSISEVVQRYTQAACDCDLWGRVLEGNQ